MLLAIDTATQFVSLALHDGRLVRAEQTWFSANNHTVELAPAVLALLAQVGVGIGDLTALAVSVGPGSYTGLRIGVALAKGIAAGRRLPLVGVGTLDILASAQPQFQGGLIATAQAGRGRVIAATYQWRKGHWKLRHDPESMRWDELIASIDGPALVTGEISEDGLKALDEARFNGTPVTIAPPAQRLRRAGFLAEEAWSRLREEKSDFPAAAVAPVYVKTKDIP